MVWMTLVLCWRNSRFSGEAARGKAAKQSIALHSIVNPPTMYAS